MIIMWHNAREAHVFKMFYSKHIGLSSYMLNIDSSRRYMQKKTHKTIKKWKCFNDRFRFVIPFFLRKIFQSWIKANLFNLTHFWNVESILSLSLKVVVIVSPIHLMEIKLVIIFLFSLTLKGVFTKNERGYRFTAKNKRFWSLLILLLSVASIRRKLLKTTHTPFIFCKHFL